MKFRLSAKFWERKEERRKEKRKRGWSRGGDANHARLVTTHPLRVSVGRGERRGVKSEVNPTRGRMSSEDEWKV